jgi:hypothetical protein
VLFGPLDPGWGKNPDPGSGNRDEHPNLVCENLVSVFGLKILKFFDADPDPGSCPSWIGDP